MDFHLELYERLVVEIWVTTEELDVLGYDPSDYIRVNGHSQIELIPSHQEVQIAGCHICAIL